jgi:hypothetical protein
LGVSKKERATKEETPLPPARSARVFVFFPSFEAANHCLVVLVSARSRLQARVIDALYTQASVRREASRERCRESEQSIEEGGRKRERESLQGFFFVRFLFDVPASCDACRTPSAANLLIRKCVGAKGVERASAGGELGEKKKEEKGCCCCCFFFSPLRRPFPLSFHPSILTLPSPPLRQRSPVRARTGPQRRSLAHPRGRARGGGPPFGRTSRKKKEERVVFFFLAERALSSEEILSQTHFFLVKEEELKKPNPPSFVQLRLRAFREECP